MSSCGVEEAREVMERARENVHIATTTTAMDSPLQKNGVDTEEENETVGGDDGGLAGGGGEKGGGGKGQSGSKGGGGVGAGLGSGLVADGIRSLIRATWEDVKDWCDEEAEARVRRKDAQVRLELNTHHQFTSFLHMPPFDECTRVAASFLSHKCCLAYVSNDRRPSILPCKFKITPSGRGSSALVLV